MIARSTAAADGDRRARWALFLLMFVSSAFFHQAVEYDNTLSREFLLSSAVDDGRLDLGARAAETVDVSPSGERVYSNKPFGLPLIAAPAYALLRRLPALRARGPLAPEVVYLTRLWAVSLPHAALGPLLFDLMIALGAASSAAFLAVLGFALGTPAWLHAAQFSGHETAGALALASFAACRALSAQRRGSAAAWLGAGLLAGLAALCEFQAGWLALVVAAYAAFRAPDRRARAAFAAGGAACAALLLAYDRACFGSWWTVSYARQGAAFADSARVGFVGVSFPEPVAAAKLLFSPSRGLFFVSPVLLPALPGFAALFRRREIRAEALALAAACAGAFAINAGYSNWHAGWSFGPRYLVSALPFLTVAAAFAPVGAWFAPLFALSFAQNAAAQFVTPYCPQYFANPVVESLWPLSRAGYAADSLGTLFGLGALGAVAVFAAACAGIAAWGRPRGGAPRRPAPIWAAVYGTACAAILAGLAFARSPNADAVRVTNAKLLSDFEDARPSARARAIAEEWRRADVRQLRR